MLKKYSVNLRETLKIIINGVTNKLVQQSKQNSKNYSVQKKAGKGKKIQMKQKENNKMVDLNSNLPMIAMKLSRVNQ